MESLEEHLHHAGVSSTHATRYLQQVRTFRAQLQTAFAPADAVRILAALELMVELHLDQAAGPEALEHRVQQEMLGRACDQAGAELAEDWSFANSDLTASTQAKWA